MPLLLRKQSAAKQNSTGEQKVEGTVRKPFDMHSGLSRIQQGYGNKAAEHLFRWFKDPQLSMSDTPSHAIRELDAPYDTVARWLEIEAETRGRLDWLQNFMKLSKPQRQAVIHTMGWARHFSPAELERKQVDWGRLIATLQFVETVPLEKEDQDSEAAIEEDQVLKLRHTANVTGLITPYSDIVKWLNYKANKQGKTRLMREFDALTIPQKKAAIIKMANLRQLDFKSFTEALSLHIMLEKWVDWESVTSAIRSAGKLKPEDITEEKLAEMTEEPRSSDQWLDEEAEEDQEESSGGWAALLLAGGSLADEEEQEQVTKMGEDRTTFVSYLAGLGALGAAIGVIYAALQTNKSVADASRSAIVSSLSGAAASLKKEEAVDRYLNVSPQHKAEHLKDARQRELKKQGFVSMEQCFAKIAAELSTILFNRGVMDSDPACLKLIQKLGLTCEAGKSPSPSEIAKQINRLMS